MLLFGDWESRNRNGEEHSGEEATHFNGRSAYLVGDSTRRFPSSFLRYSLLRSFSPGGYPIHSLSLSLSIWGGVWLVGMGILIEQFV